MPEYRRANTEGGTYFFTVNTYRRQPILTEASVRLALREGIAKARERFPFEIQAWVLLPDHLHCIWKLSVPEIRHDRRHGDPHRRRRSDNQATADSGKEQKAALPLTYKALVRLGAQHLDIDGEELRLAPGMQVIAEIHQGRRTVMEYLLSPVQKAFHEAGRER